MKVKDVLPFLKEKELEFKVHCGRDSTDTFLPLHLFFQDQSIYKVWQEEQRRKIFKEKIFCHLYIGTKMNGFLREYTKVSL